jgi:hypothetical protein
MPCFTAKLAKAQANLKRGTTDVDFLHVMDSLMFRKRAVKILSGADCYWHSAGYQVGHLQQWFHHR